MEKKAIYVVAIVAVLVAASVGVYAVVGNKDDVDSPASMEGAELKVLGNANGDRVIDSKDIDVIEKAIDDGVALKDAPLADANNDGVIDDKDIEVVKKIINKESVTVWHINYHDVDGDSTMDMERVSTQYPVSAAIMTGSANSFIMCYMIGIIDEIKGASYGSSNDSTLFGSTYLNTSKTVKLGTSSTSITFEDGKAGSSNVIAEKGVTCVLSDWNRTYLTNESAFETAGVDVVRVAAASVDKEVYTHSILLLGFLFQKESRASDLVDLYDSTMKTIKDAVSTLPEDKKVKAVASSMNGYISSGNSDYQRSSMSQVRSSDSRITADSVRAPVSRWWTTEAYSTPPSTTGTTSSISGPPSDTEPPPPAPRRIGTPILRLSTHGPTTGRREVRS